MRRAEVPEQRVDAPWGCRCGATNCKGARQCEAPGGPSRSRLGALSEPSRNLPAGARVRHVVLPRVRQARPPDRVLQV